MSFLTLRAVTRSRMKQSMNLMLYHRPKSLILWRCGLLATDSARDHGLPRNGNKKFAPIVGDVIVVDAEQESPVLAGLNSQDILRADCQDLGLTPAAISKLGEQGAAWDLRGRQAAWLPVGYAVHIHRTAIAQVNRTFRRDLEPHSRFNVNSSVAPPSGGEDAKSPRRRSGAL